MISFSRSRSVVAQALDSFFSALRVTLFALLLDGHTMGKKNKSKK